MLTASLLKMKTYKNRKKSLPSYIYIHTQKMNLYKNEILRCLDKKSATIITEKQSHECSGFFSEVHYF